MLTGQPNPTASESRKRKTPEPSFTQSKTADGKPAFFRKPKPPSDVQAPDLSRVGEGKEEAKSSLSSNQDQQENPTDHSDNSEEPKQKRRKLQVVKKPENESKESANNFALLNLGSYHREYGPNILRKVLDKSPVLKAIGESSAEGKNIQENLRAILTKHFNANFGEISSAPREWFLPSREAEKYAHEYMAALNKRYPGRAAFKCHTVEMTEIQGKKICYISVSGDPQKDWTQKAWAQAEATVNKLNENRTDGVVWSLVERLEDKKLADFNRLINDVLSLLHLDHENPDKPCAEKSYLAMLLKLLARHGSALQVTGVINCLTLENKKYKFIDCCPEGCTPNKIASMLLCALAQRIGQNAIEAHQGTPEFLSPLIRKELLPLRGALAPLPVAAKLTM